MKVRNFENNLKINQAFFVSDTALNLFYMKFHRLSFKKYKNTTEIGRKRRDY